MILPARCWDKLDIGNDSFGPMQSRRLIWCSVIKYMPVKDLYRIEIDDLDKIALTFVKKLYSIFTSVCTDFWTLSLCWSSPANIPAFGARLGHRRRYV